MNELIRFPHLGWEFYVGKGITIGNFTIAYYGIVIAVGMLLAMWMAQREAKRTGQDLDHYTDLSFIAIFFGILGARIYYVIFEWDYYSNHLKDIVNLRKGGLAIYGGIILGVVAVLIYTRIKHLNPWLVLDTVLLVVPIGQLFGRWGNFFNREAYGTYTDSLLAMQIPVSEAQVVTPELMEHSVTIFGEAFIQVHPTFLYESLWNLGVFLLLMLYRKHRKAYGEIVALYLIGYGLGRTWIEGLRMDSLMLGNTGIRVSQALSIALVLAGIIIFLARRHCCATIHTEEKRGSSESASMGAGMASKDVDSIAESIVAEQVESEGKGE